MIRSIKRVCIVCVRDLQMAVIYKYPFLSVDSLMMSTNYFS